MNPKQIIISMVVLALLSSTASAEWLGGYDYRKEIVLTDDISGAQTDYTIMLNVSYNAKMQDNFTDVRFTKTDGNTLIRTVIK